MAPSYLVGRKGKVTVVNREGKDKERTLVSMDGRVVGALLNTAPLFLSKSRLFYSVLLKNSNSLLPGCDYKMQNMLYNIYNVSINLDVQKEYTTDC